MTKKVGFKEAKRRAIEALRNKTYQIEERQEIETKNLLYGNTVSEEDVIEIIIKCRGQDHEMQPHHMVKTVDVHILRKDGWYIKFYFLDPETFFLSVHR
ncbi:hypothetical protein FDP25_00025 [Roseovarius sp. A21]|uniref:Uncharacterized protein n=1 Tax=Roseovarius bejariae TaxID=2576383 RepID=A0A844CW01_9RHOB|nr:hypothetical protein [Roseovarius bejariae]MRU13813.1 hypothetical protein [Roseovarius bejariae]